MQFLQVLLASTLAISQASAIGARIGRSDLVLVRAVINGDTIVVSNVGRVRLLGIDAPDIAHGQATPAPFGREARDRLTALLLNRWVRLELDGASIDSRRIAYVVTGDGTFVNATMVREGLARVSARLPLTRLSELQRAEAEAQAFRRGMWGNAPQIPSAGYTRRSKSKASRPPTSRTKSPSRQRRSPHKTEP